MPELDRKFITWRRVALGALALATTTLAALTIAAAARDRTPPRLYYEAPVRVAAGAEVEVFVSADEPVTYVLSYAGEDHEVVTQDHTFTLTAAPGDNVITILATDGFDNSTTVESRLIGVPEVELELQALGRVRSGDPLGIRLSWPEPRDQTEARVTSYWVRLGDTLQYVAEMPGVGVYSVAATPLTVEPTELELVASIEDEFGRLVEVRQTVVLEPLPVTVEQLALSPQTLSVITPEGRELEATTLAAALAQTVSEPYWSEPFLMPIPGRETSGFADARRYAPGGPVSFHNGLDLAAPSGTPVLATNDGKVLIAGTYPIKGGWVLIDHGYGVTSWYFHQSKILVEVGQMVARGDVIGEVGTTGLSTGPHLHWEMRVGELPTSPLVWVDKVAP